MHLGGGSSSCGHDARTGVVNVHWVVSLEGVEGIEP